MNTRTVWFGAPVFVMRPLRNSIGLTVLYLGLMLVYVGLVQMDVIPLNWLLNPVHFALAVVFPAGVLMAFMLRFAIRIDPFKKQFYASGGRVCFVCGYEIGEGLEQCSECGAGWSLDDLSKGWRKLAEKNAKKSEKEGG